MAFEPFDVVAVPFPLAAGAEGKRRPALVVSSPSFIRGGHHLVLAMITAARGEAWPSDVHVGHWQAAGLPVPCKVRAKLLTIGQDQVLRRLGALAGPDKAAVQAMLRRCLAVSITY